MKYKHLPFSECSICGELRSAALRVKPINGQILCHCCASQGKKQGYCFTCNRYRVVEFHHVAKIHSNDGVNLCLNCHRVISAIQYRNRKLRYSYLFNWIWLFVVSWDCAILGRMEAVQGKPFYKISFPSHFDKEREIYFFLGVAALSFMVARLLAKN